jgi:hypothetical protein
MTGELSHGLQELMTRANRILRAYTMAPILLGGVNRSGLEYVKPSAAGFLAASELSFEELQHLCERWRCSVVRVPFNQTSALCGKNGTREKSI